MALDQQWAEAGRIAAAYVPGGRGSPEGEALLGAARLLVQAVLMAEKSTSGRWPGRERLRDRLCVESEQPGTVFDGLVASEVPECRFAAGRLTSGHHSLTDTSGTTRNLAVVTAIMALR